MKHVLIAAALLLGAMPAVAQVYQNAPTGQTVGGISAGSFAANNAASGFTESAIASIAGAGTTQATATNVPARFNVITSCASGAGIVLPSVQRFVPVVIMNRSGGACLVYPSPNATVESAPGTAGAVNASASQANNTTVTYRPVSPTQWLQ